MHQTERTDQASRKFETCCAKLRTPSAGVEVRAQLETRLTCELVVLPVDGRYNETVIDKITGLVASFLLGVRSGRIVSAPSRRHEYW